nr:MAG TPA: hypothetical protein [Caudoviricetes sp.]
MAGELNYTSQFGYVNAFDHSESHIYIIGHFLRLSQICCRYIHYTVKKSTVPKFLGFFLS